MMWETYANEVEGYEFQTRLGFDLNYTNLVFPILLAYADDIIIISDDVAK